MSHPASYRKLVAVQAHADLRQACEIQEVPFVAPEADEVIVKTHYAGVNAADYLMAQGRYLMPTPPPYDMGGEACGEVVAVGADVTGLQVGQHVMAIGGGFCDYFTVKARYAIPIPESSPEIITLGVSGLTASIALDIAGEMSSGETVLVTAAAGGTGSFAVQLAHIAGNHVIGTCSTDEKAEFLRSIGCDHPINYRSDDLKSVLKENYRKGIDIIFESVGGTTFDIAAKALAVKGRLIAIGAISEYESGAQPVTDVRIYSRLLHKSARVQGFWLMHYLRQAAEHTQKLLGLVATGQLKLITDSQQFNGIEGIFDAIEYLYAGKNIGKVIVTLNADA